MRGGCIRHATNTIARQKLIRRQSTSQSMEISSWYPPPHDENKALADTTTEWLRETRLMFKTSLYQQITADGRCIIPVHDEDV